MKRQNPNVKDTDENRPVLEDADAGTSRRDFLVTAVGGAAAAVIAASCSGKDSDSGGSDNSNDSEQGGTDTHEITPPPSNRVVRIINSGATSWNGQDPTDFYQYANQDSVDAMVERGLMELTSESSLEAAWRALIPYQDGDIVLIHLNAYVNSDNSAKNNVAATVSAVVYGLADVLRIPPGSIAVSDPSRTLAGSAADARIISGCRYKESIAWDLYQGEYTVPVSLSGNVNDSLARITAEADHIIMMPVLSWHGFNWITGAMKMMFGSLQSQGGSMHGVYEDTAAMADLCLSFKDRVRLLVGDGLFGNIQGNSSSPHAFQTLGGQNGSKPSSTLYFTKDMVALDSVMYDDLLEEARAEGSPKSGYQKKFLQYAADTGHQLGTFEMRDDTGAAAYSEIDLVEVNLT